MIQCGLYALEAETAMVAIVLQRARVLKTATARTRAGARGCALIRVSAVKRCWRVLQVCPLFGGVRYLECPLLGSF